MAYVTEYTSTRSFFSFIKCVVFSSASRPGRFKSGFGEPRMKAWTLMKRERSVVLCVCQRSEVSPVQVLSSERQTRMR